MRKGRVKRVWTKEQKQESVYIFLDYTPAFDIWTGNMGYSMQRMYIKQYIYIFSIRNRLIVAFS